MGLGESPFRLQERERRQRERFTELVQLHQPTAGRALQVSQLRLANGQAPTEIGRVTSGLLEAGAADRRERPPRAFEDAARPADRGLLGNIGAGLATAAGVGADAFRDVVPQGVRDVLGRGVQVPSPIGGEHDITVLPGLQQLLSGERFIDDTLKTLSLGNLDINDLPFYDTEKSPRLVRELVDALAPLNLIIAIGTAGGSLLPGTLGKIGITAALRASAGVGGRSRTVSLALRGAANMLEPFAKGSVGKALARELAADVAAQEVGYQLSSRNVSPLLALPASLVAATAAGYSPEIVRGFRRALTGVDDAAIRDALQIDPEVPPFRDRVELMPMTGGSELPRDPLTTRAVRSMEADGWFSGEFVPVQVEHGGTMWIAPDGTALSAADRIHSDAVESARLGITGGEDVAAANAALERLGWVRRSSPGDYSAWDLDDVRTRAIIEDAIDHDQVKSYVIDETSTGIAHVFTRQDFEAAKFSVTRVLSDVRRGVSGNTVRFEPEAPMPLDLPRADAEGPPPAPLERPAVQALAAPLPVQGGLPGVADDVTRAAPEGVPVDPLTAPGSDVVPAPEPLPGQLDLEAGMRAQSVSQETGFPVEQIVEADQFNLAQRAKEEDAARLTASLRERDDEAREAFAAQSAGGAGGEVTGLRGDDLIEAVVELRVGSVAELQDLPRLRELVEAQVLGRPARRDAAGMIDGADFEELRAAASDLGADISAGRPVSVREADIPVEEIVRRSLAGGAEADFSAATVDDVIARNVEEFGLTDDLGSAFYILPDGRMLDGTQGGAGGFRARAFDHRNIDAPELDRLRDPGSNVGEMNGFMEAGAIRYMPETNGFDLVQPPTASQRRRMAEGLQEGDVLIDVSAPDGSVIASGGPFTLRRELDEFLAENDLVMGSRGGTAPEELSSAIPREIQLDPREIDTRPDQFQARDVPPGQATDPDRVARIRDNFEPERFEAISVVLDPDSGRHVVVAGHHRLQAARELGLESVPARVVTGDLATDAGRAAVQREAILSNFLVAPNNIREQGRAFRLLQDGGLSAADIGKQTGQTEGRVQKAIDIELAGRQIQERVLANAQLTDIAAEVGSAVRRHGITQDEAFALFDTMTHAGDGTTLPSATAVRTQLDKFAPEIAQGELVLELSGTFEGMGRTPLLEAIHRSAEIRTELERSINRLHRDLKALERIGEQFGEDVSSLTGRLRAELVDVQQRLVTVDDEVVAVIRGENLANRAGTSSEALDAADDVTIDPEREAFPQQAGPGLFDIDQGHAAAARSAGLQPDLRPPPASVDGPPSDPALNGRSAGYETGLLPPPIARDVDPPAPPRFDDTGARQSSLAGIGPPRGAAPTVPGAGEPPPGGRFDAISGGSAGKPEIDDLLIPGEDPGLELVRVYSGRVNTWAADVQAQVRFGNSLAPDGVGVRVKDRLILREDDPGVFELNMALRDQAGVRSGARHVPPEWQDVYDEAIGMRDWEESATFDFDPKFGGVRDYFYNGYRQVDLAPPGTYATNAGSGRLGGKPGFTLPRTDTPFEEVISRTWVRPDGSTFQLEPVSWNPLEQAALRAIAGVQWREQRQLIEFLKAKNLAIDVTGAPIPEGFRVPRVGPAFEGRAFQNPQGGIGFAGQHAVDVRLADTLELMFGPTPTLRLGNYDIGRWMRTAGNAVKRVKLIGSLFQQVDFATRAGFSAFGAAIDDLLHGQPLEAVKDVLRFPVTVARMMEAQISVGARDRLLQRVLSDEKVIDGVDLTWRQVSEAGWSMRDDSIIRRDLQTWAEDLMKNGGADDPTVVKFVKQLSESWQNGLFDGIYPVAQMASIKHQILPRVMRAHPDWTSQQWAGEAARLVNVQYSTLADWQSVLQNPGMREFARNLFFSTNEMESLLRQGIGTVSGRNKTFWLQTYAGGAIFLGLTANLIHMAGSDGDPLPLDRYLPIKPDPYSPIGWGYNNQFFSPDVPLLSGRGDSVIAMDLMGQMDTIFRVLDPAGFIGARTNVIPRTLINQMSGTDFYGRSLEGPVERGFQAASDLFAPIGAGQVLGAARGAGFNPGGIIPENEGRLGVGGQLAQASGVNLRAQTTRQLLDQAALQHFPESGGFDGLEPHQQRQLEELTPGLADELDRRRTTGALRGSEAQQRSMNLGQIDEQRMTHEAGLTELMSGGLVGREVRNRFNAIQGEAAAMRAGLDLGYQDFLAGRDAPTEPNEIALFQWYQSYDESTDVAGGLDFDQLEKVQADLVATWTQEQRGFVERNTGLSRHDPGLTEFLDTRDELRETEFFDIGDEVWRIIQQQLPASMTEQFAEFDSFFQWREDARRGITLALEERGMPLGVAAQEAERLFERHAVAKAFSELRNRAERIWIASHPATAILAAKYGYLQTNADERAFLTATAAGGGGVRRETQAIPSTG